MVRVNLIVFSVTAYLFKFWNLKKFKKIYVEQKPNMK